MSKKKRSAEKTVRAIRRATRRQYSAEEKIRIVLERLRSESGISALCRNESLDQNPHYRWYKESLEAVNKRLTGDSARRANFDEVKDLPPEAAQMTEAPSRPGTTIHEIASPGETRSFHHARVVLHHWRQDYLEHRPHPMLGYKSPAEMIEQLRNQ